MEVNVMALRRNNLKRYREGRTLSQERLAHMANVSRQTIISIEGGKYVPSLELALRLAIIFECQVEDIFGL